jgi:hypothetical protein
MTMGNATVTGSAITMRDVLSYDAAARAASSEAAFEGTVGLVIRTLFKAHAKFAEMDLLYGSGAVASAGTALTPSMFQSALSTQAGGSGASVTITVTYASWAPAMLSGFQNAYLDCYNAGSQVNTNAPLKIVSINPTPASSSVGGTIVLTSTSAADLNAVYALTGTTLDYYWYTAYGNNMAGLKAILTNTGTMFGIAGGTYDLWVSNTFDCASTQMTFSKLQQATALATSRGLDESVLALFNPVTFAYLVNEQAGARRYDSSYKPAKNENGSEALTFWGPSGKIEVIPHIYCHQGEGFIIPPAELIKVGPLDHITPTLPGIDGDIFFQSPTQASYEVRLFSDFGLLNNMPAKSTWIKSITNSVSA